MRQHHRQAYGTLRPNDVLHPGEPLAQHGVIQKQDRAERLVLRRRAHSAGGEVREKCRHLRRAHLEGMAHGVEHDEAPNPRHIRLLRS